MEEEKAAAYYDELSRKGEGAARFKQGVGFSSSAPNATFQNPLPPSSPNSSKPPLSRRSKHSSNPSTTISRKSPLLSLGFQAGIGIAIEVEDESGAEKNEGKGAEAEIDTRK